MEDSSSTAQVSSTRPSEFSTFQKFTPAETSEIQYRNPAERAADGLTIGGSISRPNYEDMLRRVSVVIHQHIEKCEKRFNEITPETEETGLFHKSKMEQFSEDNFISPEYVFHFVRAPITRLGFCYGIRKHQPIYKTPSLQEVHTFLSDIFFKAQLTPECSIVCLIYVERLMEKAHVPVVATTWKPVLLCGLLLASKVWQDKSSWNVDITEVYPQFSLRSVNRLERIFCSLLEWQLYISQSLYAKYYFALRSLTSKNDFRRNYNAMVLQAPGAKQIAERSGDAQNLGETGNLSRSL